MNAIYGLVVLLGFVLLVGVSFFLPIWALRRHNRMFPKGWDRTGWTPEPGRARRLETMWTLFSGRGGSGG